MAQVLNREFQIHKDINGYPSYLRTLLVAGDFMSLAPGVEQVFTVPNGINLVMFSKDSGNTLFVLINNSALDVIVSPTAGSSIPNSYVDINVIGVSVSAGEIIHLLSPVATYVKINYFNDNTSQ